MNATPPEARPEYSRGPSGSSSGSGRPARGSARGRGGSAVGGTNVFGRRLRAGLLVGGLLGAALLLVAEFTILFHVSTASDPAPIRSVTTGSHHAYALVPIALLSAALAC